MSELSTEGFVSIEQDRPSETPTVPPVEAVEREEAAPAPEGAEPDADSPDEPEAANDDASPAKPKQSAQERIAEITRARREAEREARYWKEIAEGKGPQQQEKQPDPSPDPDRFEYGETDPAYIRAVIAHEVKTGIEKGLDDNRASMAQDLQLQAQERAWETAQDAARSKFADYDEVVQTHDESGAAKWPCTLEMAQAIKTSDVGGEVTYYLASNPAEARRIASLNPISQIRELGKIEARLEGPAVEQPKPKTATDAPKPPETSARGAGGRFTVSPDTDDFAAFEAKFNAKAN